jgi:hypothetical protein
VQQIASVQDSRPILLLIGSSLTQYGLDPAVLENVLASKGRNYRVIKFAWGGLSPLERLYYLKFILSYSEHSPAAVIFEVSQYYDLMPLLQFENNLLTNRMIEMMDWRTALFALRWVYYDSPSNLKGKVSLSWSIIRHCIDRYTLAGQAQKLEPFKAVLPDKFEYMPPKGADIAQAEIDRRVANGIKALNSSETTKVANWDRSIYPEMISELKKHGVSRFGFYALPTPQWPELLYVKSFCMQRPGAVCILPNPELLRRLQAKSNWMDYSHLFGDGRQTTSVWFAGEAFRLLPPVAEIRASSGPVQ